MPEVAPSKEGLDNPGLVVGDEDLEAGKETETKFTPIDVDYGDKKTKEKEEENSSAITFEDLPTKDSTTASLLNWNTLMSKLCLPCSEWRSRHSKLVSMCVQLGMLVIYTAFYIGALAYHIHHQRVLQWNKGLGLLHILSIFVYAYLIYSFGIRRAWEWFFDHSKFGQKMTESLFRPATEAYQKVSEKPWFTPGMIFLVVIVLFIFVGADSQGDPKKLQSAFGIVVLVLIGAAFSKHPDRINWRTVIWGLLLQYIMGLIVLRWPVGRRLIEILSEQVTALLDYTKAGSGFVYGSLVSKQPFNPSAVANDSQSYEVMKEINEAQAFNDVFAFSILSVVIFFGFIVSMLFHLGAMQWLIMKIGWVLKVTMGTTPCESLTASANIFIGQSEAPLMVKPFLGKMTPSELHAVMTGGFASIAGAVLGAYISFGVSPIHLITASVMSAPAALACAKLLMPETKKTKATISDISALQSPAANLLDAASQGAASSVLLVGHIIGGLISMMAFVALVNGILSYVGRLFSDPSVDPELSLDLIFGKVFYPLAWLLGVDDQDLEKVGELIGIKSTINEFVAYSKLKDIRETMTDRSVTISTYALCGFSNLASLGIQTAALSSMAPQRSGDISQVAFRAFISGSMACFLTACVAGSLID